MITYKQFVEKMKDPCWKNYKMVGTKQKDGKTVPNCVPEENLDEDIEEIFEVTGLELYEDWDELTEEAEKK